MKNITSNSKSNYFIHLIYASSFLVAVLAVIGYLIWSKYQTTVQHQIELEQRITFQNQIEQAKKARVISCLQKTGQLYNEGWAAACRANAQDIQAKLTTCISGSAKSAKFISGDGSLINYQDLYQNYVAQCKAVLGTPNPKPNCLLPNAMAKNLDEELQKAQQLCTIIS